MNTHIVYGMSFLFQNDLENSNSNLKGECHGDACESDAAVTLTAGHALCRACALHSWLKMMHCSSPLKAASAIAARGPLLAPPPGGCLVGGGG